MTLLAWWQESGLLASDPQVPDGLLPQVPIPQLPRLEQQRSLR
jgi:hypothetical protein